MAWYTITHRCGHTSEQQIYGPNSRGERERIAAGSGRRPCPDCCAAERAHQAAIDTDAATAMGLPDLDGSPRQVQWAISLRARALDALDAACRDAELSAADHDQLRNVLIAQSSAHQWIQYRGGTASRSRLKSVIISGIDHTPLLELIAAWSNDPDRDAIDRFVSALNRVEEPRRES